MISVIRKNYNELNMDGKTFPIKIFLNENLKIEKTAIDELINLFELENILNELWSTQSELFEDKPTIDEIVITPDFHKGNGIPIGTTIKTSNTYFPKAIGSDINCGMNIFKVNITREQIENNKEKLIKELRYNFFEGGRNISLNKEQRISIFENGVYGLINSKHETNEIWNLIDRNKSKLQYNSNRLSILPNIFNKYCQSKGYTHDAFLGSIGGGNHFVELQYVEQILDTKKAYELGIKENDIFIMVHSGSLSFGKTANFFIEDKLKKFYKSRITKKIFENFYPIPTSDQFRQFHSDIFNVLNATANFAEVNRFMLGLMVSKSLTTICDNSVELLYDTPHNFIWKLDSNKFIVRKGSCRANNNELVIIPGSMGSNSFILNGLGNNYALSSSCHGAGRQLSRGNSMGKYDAEYEDFLNKFTIVTNIDIHKTRNDIRHKKLKELKQEAPFAYKKIESVIETIVDSEIATNIIKLSPIITIKS